MYLSILFFLVIFQRSEAQKPIIEWVPIPAGSFYMGSDTAEHGRDKDETLHLVKLKSFKLSKYEITFEQYDMFCVATGRTKPNDFGWGRGKMPVLGVSWDDAIAFAEWAGGRLPTEAEWEYACRAGTTTPFSSGNCLDPAYANYKADAPYINCNKGRFPNRTLPVGSLLPNAWGLHDMHGNVWEWCNDFRDNLLPNIDDYNVKEADNPQGIPSGRFRARRGGGWNFAASLCRSANRGSDLPDGKDFPIGFRIAADL